VTPSGADTGAATPLRLHRHRRPALAEFNRRTLTPRRQHHSRAVLYAASNLTLALTGVSGAGNVGALAVSHAQTATGVAGAGAVGSFLSSRTLGLTGLASSGAVGSVTTGSDVTVALTGVASTGAIGTLSPSRTCALTGGAVTGAIGAVAPNTTLALSGVSAGAAAGSVTTGSDVTRALTGVVSPRR
jgi:hypothetical protein